MWEVKDRSVAGLRIAATGGIGQSLTLGALVAVRQSDVDGWLLGVVRRLNKVSNEEVEAGVNIIAERIVAVTLAAKRRANEDMGYVVDGLDMSTMGERFEGLYLPPPSRPDKPLAMKTLIVPTSEYAEGRNVILTTGALGLHGLAAPPGRAAPRLELGDDPDRRQEGRAKLVKPLAPAVVERPELERQAALKQVRRSGRGSGDDLMIARCTASS